jgi:UMF1 family MFS transporter
MSEPRAPYGRVAPVSWALYDLAYSIFTFLILIRFLPPWIITDLDRPDWYLTVAQFVAVACVLVLMPVAGTLADQLGRRKPFLIGFTLCASAAAVVLGLVPADGSVLPLLLAGGAVAFFAQLAFAQFDPLLADVAPPETRGRVSGLAVALGFLGTVLGLLVVGQLIVGDGDKQQAFIPAAIGFVLFALPAFVFVKERSHEHAPRSAPSVRVAFGEVAQSLRAVRRHRAAFQFLAGRFLYSDAIATLSAFLAVYMDRLGGIGDGEQNAIIAAGVVSAGIGALVAGRAVERLGPRRPLVAVLPAFAACVLVTAVTGQAWTLWLASPIAGLALGVVWTSDRVFMLALTPPAVRGQFFGFFNLASRVASALGPLIIWSGTVWLLHDRTAWLSDFDASRVAMAGLAVAAILGWFVIRPLSDHPVGVTPAAGAGVSLGAEQTAR